MANNMRLSLVLSAKDRLSSVVRTSVLKSEKAFDRFQRKIDNVSKGFTDVGRRATVMGAAAMAAGGLMLKSAADFETSMTSVSTLIDTNVENLSLMNKRVLEIGKRTPVALDQLTSALYDIRSAGISASDQFSVLEKSAQLGVAGLGTTKEAVDLVTSSINAFKLTGEEQNKLYDNIFKTVKTGKTNISQLAQGFGSVAGTVAAAGIKIDDYLASVAALTTTGQPAAQAHTQMKAAIAGLTRGTKEQQAIFRTLHAKDFNDLIKKSGSVVNAFSGINRVVRGNKSKLIELLGSVEAYNAVLSLTGNQNKAYADTIFAMRYGTDAFAEAYQKQLFTINSQVQRGRNLLQKIGIDLGTYLIPPFSKFLDCVENVMNKFDALPDGAKRFIALGTVAAGAGLLMFGGLSMGIGAAVKGIGSFTKAYRAIAFFMKRHRFTAEVKAIRALGSAFQQFASTPVKLTLWNSAGINSFGSSIKQVFSGSIVSGVSKLKSGISAIPSAITGAANALKAVTINSYELIKTGITSLPSKLTAGFSSFKAGLLNIPGMLKNIPVMLKSIRAAFNALNITMALNPVGLAVAGIVAGAFLIYKYWKPIKAFFIGVWKGLREALAPTFREIQNALKPLQPVFNVVGNACRQFGNWIVKLIKPVDTAGTRAHDLGVNVGRFIGAFVKGAFAVGKFLWKINPLVAVTMAIYKNFDKICAAVDKAKNALGGFFRKNGKGGKVEITNGRATRVDGSHAGGLDYVPYDGYVAELHKGERILTAGENRRLSLGVVRESDESRQLRYFPPTPEPSEQYVFNPVIYAANADIKEIEAMIERKQREFYNRIKTERRRRKVRQYA